MNKKPIRITKSKLQQIITESVKNALKEGMTSDDPNFEKWEQIRETLGSDKMLDDIYNYLSSDELGRLVEYFNHDYDLFNDEESEY